jgi:hypothetical protein
MSDVRNKKVTKGGVLHKLETSSHARLNHSCVLFRIAAIKITSSTVSVDMLTLTGLSSWLRALTCSD